MYQEITEGIEIRVEPQFVPENSNPSHHYFFFSYRVEIRNLSEQSAQLLNRHWVIRDGNGVVREVDGEGVVGHQPILNPGESFTYTSFCPLPTPTGNMRGSYEMMRADGVSVHAKIPLFFLRNTKLSLQKGPDRDHDLRIH